ncbi:ribonuclease P protein component [Paracoccus litorisediminis]|jgi:ribonuclease P protein component|uniref:Ribonuclease P protein component n=1 Tax=Paracoccus litorisediminis TaxID=2006130 RepID=A0A844HIT3_9RHOB|nr:ribonuclease P protein component [Paracoccus litorisediminis]MTH58267.1 ribonuclease P protein component [Paracoccus litorisediminis]
MTCAAEVAAADRNVPQGQPDRAASGISGGNPVKPEILRKRADFLRAAQARRQGMPGFLLQARRRAEGEAEGVVRIGYTCSKKIGNAVARNRAKRRLRALAHEILPLQARPGWDYVLVGRPGATIERDFAELKRDLEQALSRVHGESRGRA